MRVGLVGLDGPALTRLLAEVGATVAFRARSSDAADRCGRTRPEALLVHADATAPSVVRECRPRFEGPILLVRSELASRVDDELAALDAGAAAVLRAPRLEGDAVVDPDRLASRLRARSSPPGRSPWLLLAASAGGPPALARVLAQLGEDTGARIVLAQHLDDEFTAGLASWLAERAARPVALAEDGQALDPSSAWLLRSDRQPRIDAAGRVRYRPPELDVPYRPSIDHLFESCAALPSRGVAVLFTGMGDDGARGLLALRRAGWTTFAEDAETAHARGMPDAAAALDAACRVLSIDEIAGAARRALEAPR